MKCPTCNGTGEVLDPSATCGAEITIGHETFRCAPCRVHPGQPHITMARSPRCPSCNGYDDCAVGDACQLTDEERDAMMNAGEDNWYFWADTFTEIQLAPDQDQVRAWWKERTA